MTPDQYWNRDCTLVIAYRKAAEIRNQRKNQELWLQGMYIYEALCDVAPIMRAFVKRGTKPGKYPEEPYSLTAKEREEKRDEKAERAYNKGMKRMEALKTAMDKKYGSDTNQEGGEVIDANHD